MINQNVVAPEVDRPVLSFDAETNGLWGQAFAIGALVYGENGEELDRFAGRLPDSAVNDPWVIENVLPQLSGMPVSHESYGSLLVDFAKFYLKHEDGKDILVHMGFPVETKILFDMHERGLMGDNVSPFPLIDVSGHLQQVGEDPTSVDAYIAKRGLEVRNFVGEAHNPLYDAEAAYVAYRYLRHLGGAAVQPEIGG
jgi:hypothetical protein